MTAEKQTIRKRFLKKVAQNKAGCWVWQAGNASDGYGSFWLNGRTMMAHRASWMIYKGVIPDGMYVLHKCDNRKCVNPDHLFLGTNADNMLDRDLKGRQAKGEQNGNAKLSSSDVEAIRRLRALGYLQEDIASRFGVSRQIIGNIIRGENWGWLNE